MYATILTFPRILYQAREDFEARRPWLVQLIHHKTLVGWYVSVDIYCTSGTIYYAKWAFVNSSMQRFAASSTVSLSFKDLQNNVPVRNVHKRLPQNLPFRLKQNLFHIVRLHTSVLARKNEV